jgi:hypothetical protein
MADLDITLLGVFMRKSGQPPGFQNHLTEALDGRVGPSYSEPTLQPGRTPGPRFAGGAPGLPVKDGRRVGRRSASSQPHREWRASREGPGAAAGAFSFGAREADASRWGGGNPVAFPPGERNCANRRARSPVGSVLFDFPCSRAAGSVVRSRAARLARARSGLRLSPLRLSRQFGCSVSNPGAVQAAA